MTYRQLRPDEWIIGMIPKSDCSDYDPEYIGPNWADLLDLLVKEGFTPDEPFLILFGGKMDSPGRECSAPTYTTRRKYVLRILREALDDVYGQRQWNAGQAGLFAQDSLNTPDLAKRLVSLNTLPQHITGIVVRRVR